VREQKGQYLYLLQDVPNLVLQDVAPLSLGIQTKGDIMSVVISRNTTIPIKNTKDFTTLLDNQVSAQFKVYDGERATKIVVKYLISVCLQ
jgi:L1 cell adhesion molecule like protein